MVCRSYHPVTYKRLSLSTESANKYCNGENVCGARTGEIRDRSAKPRRYPHVRTPSRLSTRRSSISPQIRVMKGSVQDALKTIEPTITTAGARPVNNPKRPHTVCVIDDGGNGEQPLSQYHALSGLHAKSGASPLTYRWPVKSLDSSSHPHLEQQIVLFLSYQFFATSTIIPPEDFFLHMLQQQTI